MNVHLLPASLGCTQQEDVEQGVVEAVEENRPMASNNGRKTLKASDEVALMVPEEQKLREVHHLGLP